MKPKWEIIIEGHKNDVARLMVPGGWIVRSLTYSNGMGVDARAICESMVFVPDLIHKWSIEE